MKSLTSTLSVRYNETDQMGIVHHGNYAAYFEFSRIEFFRQMGLPYKELEERGFMMPVTEMKIKFLKPAYFDDILKIKTTLREMPTGARIIFDYEISNENNEILTLSSTVLAFIDKTTRRPVRCPKEILELLEKSNS